MKLDKVFSLKVASYFCFSIVFLVLFVTYFTNAPTLAPSFVDDSLAVQTEISISNHSNNIATAKLFSDNTLLKGINFVHTQTTDKLSALNETLGSGVCAFDYDNDGWVDLFLVGGSGHTRHYGKDAWWHSSQGNTLLRNIQGQSFSDVTLSAGLSAKGWGMGCASGDLDNDGDLDLLITTIGKNFLYRNNADGTFTDVTNESGLSGDLWSTSVTIADYDNDGLLDFYICNYLRFSKGARTFEFNTGFESTLPVTFNPALYDGQANQLYRNLGNLQFEEVAGVANVDDPAGRSLSAIWSDIDNDHVVDLLVINDQGSPSQLFLNQGDGRFLKAPANYRIETAMGGHSAMVADLNNDQYKDILISTSIGQAPVTLINDGHQLEDLSWDIGISRDEDLVLSNWGHAAADFNNDGGMDIFIANGLTTPDSDAPYVTQGQNNQLFLNNGHGSFIHSKMYEGSDLSGRGVAAADFDNDGDIDLFVTNNNNRGQLFTNESNDLNSDNHWLNIRLINKHGNSDGFGTNVRIALQDPDKTLVRDFSSRASFLSQSEHRFHFGLGESNVIHQLEINWPDGEQSLLHDVPADQFINIHQGQDNFTAIKHAYPKPESDISLKTPFDQYPLAYFNWFITAAHDENITKELIRKFLVLETKDKIKILAYLKTTPRSAFLPVVYSSLFQDDVQLTVAAIQVLKVYEFEHSVYWLLDLFSQPSTEIRCELANTFRFFFQEEEAITHRKYLAIPYLLRLLDDPKHEVKHCALQALAEAERYRGIHPIINLLNTDNEATKVEAIHTLGRLRERKALKELQAIISSSNESPVILAHTLIALQRLNDAEIDAYLDALIQYQKNKPFPDSVNKAIKIAHTLLTEKIDAVVIPKQHISQRLINAVIGSGLSENIDLFAEQAELAQLLLDTLAHTHDPQAIALIKPFTHHRNSIIRVAAYQALINHAAPDALQLSEQALFDDDLHVRKTVLALIVDRSIQLSHTTLEQLLKNSDTVSLALKLAAPIYTNQLSPVVVSILMNTANKSGLLLALETCQKLNANNISVPHALITHNNKDIAVTAFACAAQQNFHSFNDEQIVDAMNVLIDREAAITVKVLDAIVNSNFKKKNKLLINLLDDNILSPDGLIYLLSSTSKSRYANNEFLLIKAMNHKDYRVRLKAFELIGPYSSKKVVQDKLWSVFTQPDQEIDLRTAAGNALIQHRSDDVLAFIRQ